MKRKITDKSGITLIALVITIIVLLILAGVTIDMLSGENGILKQVSNAKSSSEIEGKKEKIKLALTAAMINENHKIEEGKLEEELKKYFDEVSVKRNNGFIIKVDGEVYFTGETGDLSGNIYTISEAQMIDGKVNILNSTGDDLVDYKIYGNSVQNGTPSPDNPIEIQSVGDKTNNLYGGQSEYTLSKVTNDTHMSFYKAFEIGKTYTLFCYIDNTQGTANAQFRMSVGTTTGWKYLSSNSVATGKEGYSRVIITIPENYNNNLNMQYQVNGGTSTFKDIMLVEGSYNVNNLPTYEPYGYKIQVNINRGNLYDKNTIKNGFVPISGTYPTQNSTYPNAQYQTIKLDSGKTYYFTTSVKANGRIRYADPLIPNVSINLIQTSTLNNEYFTTDKVQDNQFNDATFKIKKDVILIIAGLKGLSSYTDLSFKEEPVITNIYLNEPLRKIGDYTDYIDFENKKIVRNVEVIDNTGTLTLEESLKRLTTPIEETIELPTI